MSDHEKGSHAEPGHDTRRAARSYLMSALATDHRCSANFNEAMALSYPSKSPDRSSTVQTNLRPMVVDVVTSLLLASTSVSERPKRSESSDNFSWRTS